MALWALWTHRPDHSSWAQGRNKGDQTLFCRRPAGRGKQGATLRNGTRGPRAALPQWCQWLGTPTPGSPCLAPRSHSQAGPEALRALCLLGQGSFRPRRLLPPSSSLNSHRVPECQLEVGSEGCSLPSPPGTSEVTADHGATGMPEADEWAGHSSEGQQDRRVGTTALQESPGGKRQCPHALGHQAGPSRWRASLTLRP